MRNTAFKDFLALENDRALVYRKGLFQKSAFMQANLKHINEFLPMCVHMDLGDALAYLKDKLEANRVAHQEDFAELRNLFEEWDDAQFIDD